MKNSNLFELFNTYLLERFLLHFIPGIILYFGLISLVNISSGEGLLSLVIVGSLSWGLGLLLEILLFNSVYTDRESENGISRKRTHYLLFSKLGASCVIASLLVFIASTTNFLEYWFYNSDFQMTEIIIKRIIPLIIGAILWYKFYQKLSEN